MSKQTASLYEKLEKLEKQKQELLNQRRLEILKIIEATSSLTIDDKLLAGALLFLNDQKNKSHPIIDEFKSYINKKQSIRNSNTKVKNEINNKAKDN